MSSNGSFPDVFSRSSAVSKFFFWIFLTCRICSIKAYFFDNTALILFSQIFSTGFKRNAAAVTNGHSGRMSFKNPSHVQKGQGTHRQKPRKSGKQAALFQAAFRRIQKEAGQSFAVCSKSRNKRRIRRSLSALRTHRRKMSLFRRTRRHQDIGSVRDTAASQRFLPPYPSISLKIEAISEAHPKKS